MTVGELLALSVIYDCATKKSNFCIMTEGWFYLNSKLFYGLFDVFFSVSFLLGGIGNSQHVLTALYKLE